MKKMIILFCTLIINVAVFQIKAQTVIWGEDFEVEWHNNWYVSNGTWEVGVPTSGPGSAYNGNNCAATVLSGNYSEPVESRLIRFTSFVVPSASDNPRLRFWHWYSFSSADYGKVQIKVEGTNDWLDISTNYTSTGSNIWSYPMIDLKDYAGQTVQLAFYFYSVQSGSFGNVSSGWYIDDVELVTGPYVFNNPEGFECGTGDWYVDKGTWEIGTPTAGPGSAHSGVQCAATVLKGNYAEPVSSRLISPTFVVPSASDNPRLRFWHWYSFSSADYGRVQIKVEGTNEWLDISTDYTSTGSNTWSYPMIDLKDYAGQIVQVAFYFYSVQSGSFGNVSSGWYIDDVVFNGLNTLPLIDAGQDKYICKGDSIKIGGDPTATGNYPGFKYLWTPSEGLSSDNVANPVASPLVTTTYTVTVTNIEGCILPDQVTVNVYPNPIADAGIDTAICYGKSVKIGGSPTATGGTAPYTYLWTGDYVGNTAVANPSVSPLVTQDYKLVVTDANNCKHTDYVNVLVRPLPTVSAGSDIEMCLGDTISIGGSPTVQGGTAPYSYSWNPLENLDNYTSPNPKTNTTKSRYYKVLVNDSKGCMQMDSIYITVHQLPEFTIIGVDTIKTENGSEEFYIFDNLNKYSYTIIPTPDNEFWRNDSLIVQVSPKNATTIYEIICINEMTGCENNQNIEIIYKVSTDIFNLANSNNTFYMFPNPTYSSISVKSKDAIQIVKIKIIDLNGVILKDVELNESINEFQMDLNDIKNGIYILQLVDNSGFTYYSKVIKE